MTERNFIICIEWCSVLVRECTLIRVGCLQSLQSPGHLLTSAEDSHFAEYIRGKKKGAELTSPPYRFISMRLMVSLGIRSFSGVDECMQLATNRHS